jgi:hypothetical protein
MVLGPVASCDHLPVPRSTPRDLANEIAVSRGRWRLYGARFAHKGGARASMRGVRVDHVWVSLDGGRLACSMQFSGRLETQLRALARAARRAGYSPARLKGWLFAVRVVRASELTAEMRRIAAVAQKPAVLAEFPARSLRAPRFSRAPVSREVLARLRRASGWEWEWVGASRRGPSTLVRVPGCVVSPWCSLLSAGGKTRLDLGVGLYAQSSGPRGELEARRVRGLLLAALTPHGYREIKFRRMGGRPAGFTMTKEVGALSDARRERGQLDRLIFG